MRTLLFIFCYFNTICLCNGQKKFPYVDSFATIPPNVKNEIVKKKVAKVLYIDSSIVSIQRFKGSIRATCFFERSNSNLEIIFYIKRKDVEILTIKEVCSVDSGHTYNRWFEFKNHKLIDIDLMYLSPGCGGISLGEERERFLRECYNEKFKLPFLKDYCNKILQKFRKNKIPRIDYFNGKHYDF